MAFRWFVEKGLGWAATVLLIVILGSALSGLWNGWMSATQNSRGHSREIVDRMAGEAGVSHDQW